MGLVRKSTILGLNAVSGGIPSTQMIVAKGKSTTNLNSLSGGVPFFARGLGFDGHVYVSNEWKSFTNGYVYINGAWKELDELNTNVSGSWKK